MSTQNTRESAAGYRYEVFDLTPNGPYARLALDCEAYLVDMADPGQAVAFFPDREEAVALCEALNAMIDDVDADVKANGGSVGGGVWHPLSTDIADAA